MRSPTTSRSITLLTEWLYIAAQMPHGTHAQQNVFRAVQRAGRAGLDAGPPVRGAKRLAAELRDAASATRAGPLPSEAHFDAVVADRGGAPGPRAAARRAASAAPRLPEPTVISPSDPSEAALEAFAQVVANLGWDNQAEQIVFAHTHQPLADVRCAERPRTRYWNTGCWIYEPDLGSRQAYARYLRYAWPGTAIVIDDGEPRAAAARAARRPQPAGRRRRPAGAAMSEASDVADAPGAGRRGLGAGALRRPDPDLRRPRDRLHHLPRRSRQRRIRRRVGQIVERTA